MPKKRNCRRTPDELRQHEIAVKIRKMTDQQLCKYIDGLSKAVPSVEDFFHCLYAASGRCAGKCREQKCAGGIFFSRSALREICPVHWAKS